MVSFTQDVKVQCAKYSHPEFLGTGGGESGGQGSPGCEPNHCHHRRARAPGTHPSDPPAHPIGRRGAERAPAGAATRAGYPGRGLPPVSRDPGSEPQRAWRALRESRHAAGPTRQRQVRSAPHSLIRNWNRSRTLAVVFSRNAEIWFQSIAVAVPESTTTPTA